MAYEYKFRPTSLTIHRVGDSPIFGESRTEVRLNDEAGGCFLEIHQDENDFGPGGTLRFDFDEVKTLLEAIEVLRKEAVLIEREEQQQTFSGPL